MGSKNAQKVACNLINQLGFGHSGITMIGRFNIILKTKFHNTENKYIYLYMYIS